MPDLPPPRNITTRKAEKRLDARNGYHGLYARAPISRGEIVWVSYLRPEDCGVYSWAEIKDDPILVRYSYQIGEDLFTVTRDVESDISNFFNHACDPNTWYDDSLATKVRMFLEYGMKTWSEDPTSPFFGTLRECEPLFAQYVAGRSPAPGSSAAFDRARARFEETLLADDSLEYVVARRDIAVDEHITMDYATFWVVSDLEFECRCGSPACRRHIRKDDYRQQDPAHVSTYVRSLRSR